MSSSFYRVLKSRDLSKAGDLFSVEDSIIVSEFKQIIAKIQEISSAPEFLSSHNDQSLVEIIVTRIISAVRETSTIQQHASCLVDLLQSCLAHSLRPTSRTDPPHAKMASDIMSCLFLNYNKKTVMTLAIPVAVKFLHKGNKDLSRNMSSYLSLAAIENADLLATHVQPILDSVISGNYSLSRVLPAIFSVDRQLIKNHVMTLVSILPNCADSDSLALLTLFDLVAKDSPELLEPSIPQLCECLLQQSLASSTLQVLQDIASALPLCLYDHMTAFKTTASNFPKTTVSVVQLMTVICLPSLDRSRELANYLLKVVCSVEVEKHSLVLKEVAKLTARYPAVLNINLIHQISGLEEGGNSATKCMIEDLRNEYNLRKIDRSLEKLTFEDKYRDKDKPAFKTSSSTPGGVTIVNVKGSNKSLNGKQVRSLEIDPDRDGKVITSKQQIGTTSMNNIPTESSAVQISGHSSYTTSSILPNHSSLLNNLGGKAERSTTGRVDLTGAKTELTPGARVELTSVIKHDRDIPGYHETGLPERQVARAKFTESRSTGRLPTHRSMTRLNIQANRLENRIIHKSMTRLDHRYLSNQIVSAAVTGPPPPPLKNVYNQGPGGGAVSPTKSMSSGSVTGLERDLTGREILTVNINQITTDLARQSQQLSSVFSMHLRTDNPKLPPDYSKLPPPEYSKLPPPDYMRITGGGDYIRDSSLPPVSISTNLGQPPPGSASYAPLSLPAHKRSGTHSSGPIYPPSRIYSSGPLQPPSLGSSNQQYPTSTFSPPTSGSQPLADKPTSQEKLSARYPEIPRPSFSNTLPSLRRRSHQVTSSEESSNNGPGKNRISVFEPYPMRDTVQHFCEKHLDKIKSYMESVCVKIPLPVKCTIEERKGKKHAKLHFACQGRGEHCLYKVTFYTMKSRHPRPWIHLMFLALQSRSQSALSTRDTGVSSLKNCWEIIKCEEKSFSTLVTGAFPPAKDQDFLIHELRAHRFFDVFEYNAPLLQWGCFLCNHPERATTFLTEEEPVIEGQLKEKSGGKWKIFKKWKSRYFTLSGARLGYKETKNELGITQALDVGSIRSVKVSKGGSRNIPKAFEIFTADKTFVLKAKDSSNAQEWVQCLTVAVAHSQAKDSTLRRLAHGGSLGRLTHGAGRLNPGPYTNYLRTAV